VKIVTVYAFSIENFKRPEEEVRSSSGVSRVSRVSRVRRLRRVSRVSRVSERMKCCKILQLHWEEGSRNISTSHSGVSVAARV
jgi:undecaprenyl diphosphate synthase